jgi:hypothetical protein
MQHGWFADWTKKWVWINHKDESLNSQFLEHATSLSCTIRFGSNWKSYISEITYFVRKWKLSKC